MPKTPKEASPADTARILPFPSAVTIRTIEELAGEILKQHPAAGETLALDVEHTEVITTPGIQLILALARTLEQGGGGLVILKPREEFRQSFNALGLAAQLTQWEESRWLKKS